MERLHSKLEQWTSSISPACRRSRGVARTRRSRLAIVAALQAVEHVSIAGRERLSTVFSSADGDTEVLAHLLAKLATSDIMLSPTLFHNSVFNAPAGYWSLGCKSQAASTTVCAGRASFAVGLCEASAQVLATGEAVLYIAYDMAFPEALKRLGRTTMAFACALLLEPTSDGAPGTLWHDRGLANAKLERARPTPGCRRWRKGSPATPPRQRCRC